MKLRHLDQFESYVSLAAQRWRVDPAYRLALLREATNPINTKYVKTKKEKESS